MLTYLFDPLFRKKSSYTHTCELGSGPHWMSLPWGSAVTCSKTRAHSAQICKTHCAWCAMFSVRHCVRAHGEWYFRNLSTLFSLRVYNWMSLQMCTGSNMVVRSTTGSASARARGGAEVADSWQHLCLWGYWEPESTDPHGHWLVWLCWLAPLGITDSWDSGS